MHLQSLIVSGFKSFPEAKIAFPRGITAVVGPNGTGKSNIVDAILWALGEQSPKTLRSERMEDVIFNGTELRKPIGMVEVSLVLDGVSPQDLEAISALSEELGQSTEIMITRRLYRDGDSEYFLNKIPCRLKDIRGLVWASRAGTKGHSVIEQGNIDQLLSASPLERREFIEETAGIIRYKKQKAEALRKLDSTEQNLLRVRDILNEVRRQLRSLERQAKQARNYQILQGEAKSLEIRLLSWEYRTLSETKRDIEKELAQSEEQELHRLGEETRLIAEQEEAKLSTASTGALVTQTRDQRREIEQQMAQALTAIEVERNRIEQFEHQHEQAMNERVRLIEEGQHAETQMDGIQEHITHILNEMENLTKSLAESEQKVEESVNRRSSITEEVDRLRQTLVQLTVEKTNAENGLKSISETRHSLAKRLERLSFEEKEAEAHRQKLSTEAEEYRRRGVELEGRIQELRSQRDEAEEAHRDQEQQVRDVESRLVNDQTTLAARESKLRAIEAVLHEEFGYGPTGEIEESSARGACREIKEAFAERMEVPEQFEKAIEAALGDRIKSWVVADPHDAMLGVTTFKEQGLGRGVFWPLNLPGRNEETEPSWWPQLEDESAVRGRALEFVQVPEQLTRAAFVFLNRVVIVENIESGLRIMEEREWFHGQGPTLVTLEGEILYPNGIMTGGSVGEAGGPLRRRREILRLQSSVEEVRRSLEQGQLQRESLAKETQFLNQHIKEFNASLQELEVQIVDERQEEGLRTQALPELSRRIETIRSERGSEEAEDARLSGETSELQDRLRVVEGHFAEQNTILETTHEILKGLEVEISEGQAQITQARMTLSTLETRQIHERGNWERMEEERELRKVRIQGLDQKLEGLFLQTRQSQEARLRNEDLFEQFEQRKESEEMQLRTLEEQYSQVMEKTKVLDALLAEAREALAESLKARGVIEVRLAEVRTNLHNVENTLTGTYEVSLDSLNPTWKFAGRHG